MNVNSWPLGSGKCDCQGQIHKFMSNCLTCGRILCVLEKEDTRDSDTFRCPFCDHDPDKMPDISCLMEQKDFNSISKSVYADKGLEAATKLTQKLFNADQSPSTYSNLIDEDDTEIITSTWDNICTVRNSFELARERAEEELEEKNRSTLSNLLGL